MKEYQSNSSKIVDIVERLKANDAKALDELYSYYYIRLYHFCKGLVKIEHGIDDILQDVFLKIWINRSNITSPDTFIAYMFTITKNAIISFVRAHEKEIKLKSKLLEKPLEYDFEAESRIEYKELEEKVNNLLEQLPKNSKRIYELSRKQGLSNKEISMELGVTVKTVEYHITKTLKYLKNNLSDFGLISFLLFEILR